MVPRLIEWHFKKKQSNRLQIENICTSLFHQKVYLSRNSRFQYSTLRKIKILFWFNFSSIISHLFSIPYIYTVQYSTPKWRNIELGPVLLVLFYVSKMCCAVYENIDRIYHFRSPLFLFFITREYVATRASVEPIVSNNWLNKITIFYNV